MPTPDEILKGISQAAANAYDGSHDERYMADGKARKVGLKREQGDPILDSRTIDGFTVSMAGPRLRILYHSQANLKEVHENGFENEIIGRLKDIAKYMRKEYKNVKDIQGDFELSKSFLYDCCREGRKNIGSQKISCLKKYKRLDIIKHTYRKNGNVETSHFGI